MFIDSHCHLDAAEFAQDRAQVAQDAFSAGVHTIVVPAVWAQNFADVSALATQYVFVRHALGIHPMYIEGSKESDLITLEHLLAVQLQSLRPPVAVGEIGLDYFVPDLNRDRQMAFFQAQLKLAKQFDLPVILHVRRAVDDILKCLRQAKVVGGIAHAFNGSQQQAEQFVALGFKLGFGGAMTYSRALHIRALAKNLPLEAIVLETDAPDIPPNWLEKSTRNTPQQLPKVAQILADIRGVEVRQVAEITSKNVQEVLPKIADLYTPPQVLH